MRRMALAVLVLAVPGLAPQEGRRIAKDYPKHGVYWSKTWNEAIQEAWGRNVPIFIAFHKDGSEPCDAMAALYREKQFIEKSRMWVNVAVHAGSAHDVDLEVDGKKIPKCERYFDLACKDHAEMQSTVPKTLGDLSEAPSRTFNYYKGDKLLSREKGPVNLADLVKTMDKLLAQVPGEKFSASDWRKAAAQMAEGDQAFAKKEWQMAVKSYRQAIKLGNGVLKQNAEAGLAKVNSEGELLYTEAFESQPKDGKGEFTVTKKKLRKIIEDFKSLPIEAKAREYLRGLESHGH